MNIFLVNTLLFRDGYINLKSAYTNGCTHMLFTDVIKRIIDIFLSFLNNDSQRNSRKQPYTIEKEWISAKRKESKRSIIWFQFSLLFFSSLDLDAFCKYVSTTNLFFVTFSTNKKLIYQRAKKNFNYIFFSRWKIFNYVNKISLKNLVLLM
jgi:hypothetical protein